jgi:hypothetical protein
LRRPRTAAWISDTCCATTLSTWRVKIGQIESKPGDCAMDRSVGLCGPRLPQRAGCRASLRPCRVQTIRLSVPFLARARWHWLQRPQRRQQTCAGQACQCPPVPNKEKILSLSPPRGRFG